MPNVPETRPVFTAGDRLDAFFAQDGASPAEDYAYRLEEIALVVATNFFYRDQRDLAPKLLSKAGRILLMCRGMWIE